MTWLGEAKKFLGIDLEYEPDGSICLSQKAYIEEVLERFGMENCRPSKTPLLAGERLTPQRIIGSLICAMVATRPDIAYAVSANGQFAHNPQGEHWIAIRHVLRFLRGSAILRLNSTEREISRSLATPMLIGG